MSLKKKIKSISSREERDVIKDFVDRYNLQDFNFEVENGIVVALRLKFKKLTRIPKELSTFFKLTELDLSRNQIKEISNLNNNRYLTELYLQENEITEIKGLDNCEMLEILDLSDNQIIEMEYMYKLKNLTHLSLSRNKIRKIDGLSKLHNLKVLKLNHNPIFRIENLEGQRNLETLLLSRAKIKKMERLDKLRNLRELDLASNEIKNIEGLENNLLLKKLNLKNNLLEHIENIHFLQNLEYLDVELNKLVPEEKTLLNKDIEEIRVWLKKREEELEHKREKEKIKQIKIREQIDEELSMETKIYRYGKEENLEPKYQPTLQEKSGEKKTNKKEKTRKAKKPKLPKAVILGQEDKQEESQTNQNKNEKDSKPKNPFENLEKNKKTHDNKDKDAPHQKKKNPRFAAPSWMVLKGKEEPHSLHEDENIIENEENNQIKNQEKEKAQETKSTINNQEKIIKNPKGIIEVNGKKYTNQEEWELFGDKLAQDEDYINAINAYSNSLRYNLKNSNLWIKIGIIHNNREDYTKALTAFKQAIANEPKNSAIWMYLGICFLNLKNNEDAVKSFQEAKKIDPANQMIMDYYKQIPKDFRDLYSNQDSNIGLLNNTENLPNNATKGLNSYILFKEQYEGTPVIEITDEFIIYKLISFTKHSRIWKVTEIDTKNEIVLKHILVPNDKELQEIPLSLGFREISILSYLNKQNTQHIVPLLDYFIGMHDTEKGIVLKLPYYDMGTLENRIKKILRNKEENIRKGNMISPKEVLIISSALLEALVEIHKYGIIHRDINPSNIIIDSENLQLSIADIKLIDFGVSIFINREDPSQKLKNQYICGTRGFCAPEQLDRGSKVTFNSDVFGVGATLYNLITLEKFSGRFSIPDYSREFYGSLDFLFPLVEKMLAKNPEERSSGIENIQGILVQLKQILDRF